MDYGNSKLYPIFPRYTMLKDMIKDIMHDPDYMEVCHEVDNWKKSMAYLTQEKKWIKRRTRRLGWNVYRGIWGE